MLKFGKIQELEEALKLAKEVEADTVAVKVLLTSGGSFVGQHPELSSGALIGTLQTAPRLEVPVEGGGTETLEEADLRGVTVYLEFPGGPEEAIEFAAELDERPRGLSGGIALVATLRVGREATRTIQQLSGGIALGLAVRGVEGVNMAGSEPVSSSALRAGLRASQEANQKQREAARARRLSQAQTPAPAPEAPPEPRKRSRGRKASQAALQEGLGGVQ
jgi:hypothetical protein